MYRGSIATAFLLSCAVVAGAGLRGAGHCVLVVVRQQLLGIFQQIAVARIEDADKDFSIPAIGDKSFERLLLFLAFLIRVGAVHGSQSFILINRISHYNSPILTVNFGIFFLFYSTVRKFCTTGAEFSA